MQHPMLAMEMHTLFRFTSKPCPTLLWIPRLSLLLVLKGQRDAVDAVPLVSGSGKSLALEDVPAH